MKKFTCYLLLIVFLLTPISTAHSITVKTRGKLALAAILSGIAILTKYLVDRDEQTVETLHAKLGKPDRIVDFERGFDLWRIEWYGNQKYIFRNQVFQRMVASDQNLCGCD